MLWRATGSKWVEKSTILDEFWTFRHNQKSCNAHLVMDSYCWVVVRSSGVYFATLMVMREKKVNKNFDRCSRGAGARRDEKMSFNARLGTFDISHVNCKMSFNGWFGKL